MPVKGGLQATHPETALRIVTAEKSEVRSFQADDTFYGYSEAEEGTEFFFDVPQPSSGSNGRDRSGKT